MKGPNSADAKPQTPNSAEAEVFAEIDRRRRQAEADEVNTHRVRPIEGALVDAINAWCDPRQRRGAKQRIVDKIRRVVRDADMHESIPGRAADAVLEHGLDRAEVTVILQSILERPKLVKADPEKWKPIKSRGAFFHTGIRAACVKAGIGWPPGVKAAPAERSDAP